jgi:hypothetical protein
MNDMSKKAPNKPEIPQEMQARWQRIVDLMAEILEVPSGLIMRVDLPQMEVFVSSATPGNFYSKGVRLPLDSGLYSEKVIKERTFLLVHDALKILHGHRGLRLSGELLTILVSPFYGLTRRSSAPSASWIGRKMPKPPGFKNY